MEPKAYAVGMADTKRLWLCFLSKWWLILLITLAGALLGSGLNCLYRAMNAEEDKYKAEVKMYIDYATDERDEAYMYFNDYTWKTIIGTDEIMDNVLAELAPMTITKEKITAGLDAHTPSDIRVMIVTVELDDPAKANQVIEAIAYGISRFGAEHKEFNSIEPIDMIKAELVEKPTNLVNSAIIGLIAGVIIACAAVLLYYSCDSKIRVESDLIPLVTCPVLGYETASYPAGDAKEYVTEENYSDYTGETCTVLVTYGKTTVQMLCHMLNQLSLKDCEVKGVLIVNADDKFLKRYFGREKS